MAEENLNPRDLDRMGDAIMDELIKVQNDYTESSEQKTKTVDKPYFMKSQVDYIFGGQR
jgi:hypothetical protein